ncbi:MAG: hypothetical protein LBI96_00900 [Odoribacteraceae bacterium]|nr:hypothetical protein [Odoribacteraceae bacterium]
MKKQPSRPAATARGQLLVASLLLILSACASPGTNTTGYQGNIPCTDIRVDVHNNTTLPPRTSKTSASSTWKQPRKASWETSKKWKSRTTAYTSWKTTG